MEKLKKFCQVHRNVYIYGAGEYGLYFLRAVEQTGERVAGFIISNGDTVKQYGLPVYTKDEVRKFLMSNDGVIAGFKLVGRDQIQKLLKIKIDVFSVDDYIVPLLEEYKEKFPVNKPIASKSWENILIIRLDVIGDMVFTTPFIRELRRNYPNSHITLVARTQNETILRGCPYVSELLLYECELLENIIESCFQIKSIKERVGKFVRANLVNRQYDVVFLPRDIFLGRNCVDEFLMAVCSNARYRIGRAMTNSNEKLYELVFEMMSFVKFADRPMHEAEYVLDMLQAVGMKIENKKMELWPGESAIKAAQKMLSKDNSDGVRRIAVGLASRDNARTWNPDNYRELFERLGKYYHGAIEFVLLGSDESLTASKRLDGLGNVIDLVQKTTISEAIACVSLCDLYLGSNTSILHFASAMEVPVVEISCWLQNGDKKHRMAPHRMGAYGVESISLFPPHGIDGCSGACRKPYSHCINLITVDDVANAVKNMIDKLEDLNYKAEIGFCDSCRKTHKKVYE